MRYIVDAGTTLVTPSPFLYFLVGLITVDLYAWSLPWWLLRDPHRRRPYERRQNDRLRRKRAKRCVVKGVNGGKKLKNAFRVSEGNCMRWSGMECRALEKGDGADGHTPLLGNQRCAVAGQMTRRDRRDKIRKSRRMTKLLAPVE
ncbi:hypothetical protein TRVL_09107 [Trypanosoma vivax]|nr:hypothetical protein TRVL_09107 [Trypanosoma vivax]